MYKTNKNGGASKRDTEKGRSRSINMEGTKSTKKSLGSDPNAELYIPPERFRIRPRYPDHNVKDLSYIKDRIKYPSYEEHVRVREEYKKNFENK